MIASCTAGSVEIVINGFSGEASCQLAVVAVVVFTNTVMRVRTAFAVATFLWSLIAEYWICIRLPADPTHHEVLLPAMVVAVGLLTLIANYSQEREARLAFVKHSLERDLVGSLAQSNEHLAAVALTDTLTGIANRSALDIHLTKVWSEPVLAGGACSAVMVDVDHFKQINDKYGHLYGDRVLKRVAHLLAEALRGEDDLIARFGGEEFVVILPRTPAHLAFIAAERLRGLVELAGLPAVRAEDPSLHGMRATISCGVATALPLFYPDPYVLLEAADEALYRAKREGRNRVIGSAVTDELSMDAKLS